MSIPTTTTIFGVIWSSYDMQSDAHELGNIEKTYVHIESARAEMVAQVEESASYYEDEDGDEGVIEKFDDECSFTRNDYTIKYKVVEMTIPTLMTHTV